eukprot:Hpha_TRINITY_DN14485_c0_g1::TRINITY_DN14485_c0_g1_i1::g.157950::m.157950
MSGIQLFVMVDDKKLCVEVDIAATIADVHRQLQEQESGLLGVLEYQGEPLVRQEETLADLGICPESQLMFRRAMAGFDDAPEGERFTVNRLSIPRYSDGDKDGQMVPASIAVAVRSPSGDGRCFAPGPRMPEGAREWQWRARQFLPRELSEAKIENHEGGDNWSKLEPSDIAMNLYTGVMTPGMNKERGKSGGLYDCKKDSCECHLWLSVNDVAWTNHASEGRQNLGTVMSAGKEVVFTYREGSLTIELHSRLDGLVNTVTYADVPPELIFFCQIDRFGAAVALTYSGPPQDHP